MRVLRAVAVLLAVLWAVLWAVLAGVSQVLASPSSSDAPAAHGGAAVPPLLASGSAVAPGVLQRLLSHRATAYARGDPTALRDVFVSGSPVLRRDRALMRAWSRRGLTVRGAVVSVRSVRTVSAGAGRLVVHTVDRLGPVRALWGDRVVALPRDRLSRHRIVLVRLDAGWRIAGVRVLPG